MYSFKNDYSELGHYKIYENLIKTANIQYEGYGEDSVSWQAKSLIAKKFDIAKEGIHFLSGGTQANLVFINAALSPIEAVISPDTGHICVHEAGAVEHNGNKILTAPNTDGKIRDTDIIKIYQAHTDEHMVKPRLVFISQPTEKGTIYLKKELQSIFDICKKLGLLLYIDGARLGAALSADSDLAPEDLSKFCDAFYIGGTKNGSPIGEALCIINKSLQKNFRYYLKQHGALLAKGGLIGSCFKTLFEEDLFFELAKHANKMAQKIAEALIKKGYRMSSDSFTNQIFPILPNTKITELKKHFEFYIWEKVDKKNSVVRFVCSWATKESEVDKLISIL